jgi:hypothetical protein
MEHRLSEAKYRAGAAFPPIFILTIDELGVHFAGKAGFARRSLEPI